MTKPILISILVSALLISGAFWLATQSSGSGGGSATATIVDGIQYVDISAKGGYSPRVVRAKAGMPTVLRVKTRGTFDCSASLVIPKLSYQKFLSSSGTEEIPISSEQAQGTMQGLCSMGMYNFQIQFQ
ncbi:MAG: cupredoxin domain-containing protein [bacterium]|nr:cupredoxin domain-containing protein [bacterium]